MDEKMRELTNDAVCDLVKAAGLDWHAGFNLDDENRYGTLVRLAFDLGAALSQKAEAPGWLPIETAPESGPILIISMDASQPMPAWGCYPVEDRHSGKLIGDWYITPNATMRPTHWMPLPAAPKATLAQSHIHTRQDEKQPSENIQLYNQIESKGMKP